jgi:hypothetical protein
MALKIKSSNRTNVNIEAALKEIKTEKMVALTILVPQSLRENVKIKAIHNKTNVTNVIVDYLKEYVGNK